MEQRHRLRRVHSRLVGTALVLAVFLGWAGHRTSPVSAAITTTVTFDSPTPPGPADSLIIGSFKGIDFGVNQWRWSTPYAADDTNSVYFDSHVNARSFSFAPGSRVLIGMRDDVV